MNLSNISKSKNEIKLNEYACLSTPPNLIIECELGYEAPHGSLQGGLVDEQDIHQLGLWDEGRWREGLLDREGHSHNHTQVVLHLHWKPGKKQDIVRCDTQAVSKHISYIYSLYSMPNNQTHV